MSQSLCRELFELYKEIVRILPKFNICFEKSERVAHKESGDRIAAHREMTELKKLIHNCSEKVAPFKIVEIAGMEMRAFEAEAVIELIAEINKQRESAAIRRRGSRQLTLNNLFGIFHIKESKVWFINLPHRHLTSIPRSIQKFRDLQDLNLQNSSIGEITNLEGLDCLHSLNLSQNKLHSTVGLSALKSLEYLDLSDNRINKIEQLDQLKKLRILKLNINSNLSSLSGLENLTELEELEVGDTPVRGVYSLRNSKKLKRLDLSSTGFRELQELDRFENLEELNIRSCSLIPDKMTDESLKYYRAKLGDNLHE